MTTDVTASTPVLSVSELVVEYRSRAGGARFRAVENVSFDLRAGQTLGLVGESGSGKSTTAQATLGLIRAHSGSIQILGTEVTSAKRGEMRQLRRHIQLVMQNPYSSLNPRMKVGSLIAEPLRIFGVPGGGSREDRTIQLLEMVGLPSDFASRFPHQLSGGQRQRVSIARALAVDPEILVCDEALSALDVSIQAQVLRLLAEVQSRLNLAMLFISHDLAVVRSLCHTVAVMHKGSIVEMATSEELFRNPQQEYTRRLLEAAPRADPAYERARRIGPQRQQELVYSSPHFAATDATEGAA